MSGILPWPTSSEEGLFQKFSWEMFNGGKTQTALTSLARIGDYVARIIEDPRTLNQYVFVWEQELSQKEAWAIATRVSGDDFEKKKVDVSDFIWRI
jgi:hypothetical protein